MLFLILKLLHCSHTIPDELYISFSYIAESHEEDAYMATSFPSILFLNIELLDEYLMKIAEHG